MDPNKEFKKYVPLRARTFLKEGSLFGHWKVLFETLPKTSPANKSGVRRYVCKCMKCDNTFRAVSMSDLKRKESTHCGCIPNAIKHGLSNTKLDIMYKNMMQRCYYKKSTSYENYGGRGIKVCAEWKNDINKFFEWALNNGYKENLELDREKNNLGYSPENCRFVTKKVNRNNKRNNVYVKINKEKLSIAQACSKLKIVSASTAYARISRGCSAYEAVTKERGAL